MHLLNAKWTQPAALAVLGLAGCGLLLQTMRAAYDEGGYDLSGYLVAAQALLQGHDPYKGHEAAHVIAGVQITPHAFIYPLFAALLFVPLSLLPYGLSNILWYGLSVASLLLIWRLLVGFGGGSAQGRRRRAVCLARPAPDGRAVLAAAE
jgi:hypothetical protein